MQVLSLYYVLYVYAGQWSFTFSKNVEPGTVAVHISYMDTGNFLFQNSVSGGYKVDPAAGDRHPCPEPGLCQV